MENIQHDPVKNISPSFYEMVNKKINFNLFLLKKLPAAFFSGLAIEKFDGRNCMIAVPYKWFTKNPFNSVYFACLAMAAEMSTGILAMAYLYKRNPAVSMLVTGLEATYYKKAIDKTVFACNDGMAISKAIEDSILLSVPQTIKVRSTGYNKSNELVAEFFITWSFRIKTKKVPIPV